MTSKFLSLMLCSGAIAAAIVLILVPKIEETEDRSGEGAPETVNVVDTEDAATMRKTAVMLIKSDGHYWARTLVNRKASVDFMVDTGASTVALTQDDAQKMGLRPRSLTYDIQIRTAGGITYGADVMIESIRIGEVEVRDVRGVVMQDVLTQSLLGMSFLRELYSYEFRSDRLIIKQ
ncbi:retropepsin-like aspartic protease family protein [Henriciella marina]|uniref:retropepsin-like aspartic protease family protein n=1 Tax=Henriciella marina TaxID=453851 RepID=UPI0003807931|nr:TIGR02281 family clan AA aspartic protease [Henriciella marina]